jgi:hypothetical protein
VGRARLGIRLLGCGVVGSGGAAMAGAILGDLVGLAAAVVEHSAVENAVVAR